MARLLWDRRGAWWLQQDTSQNKEVLTNTASTLARLQGKSLGELSNSHHKALQRGEGFYQGDRGRKLTKPRET